MAPFWFFSNGFFVNEWSSNPNSMLNTRAPFSLSRFLKAFIFTSFGLIEAANSKSSIWMSFIFI